nr:zinc finger protein 3 homolog [Vanessa tameamea]
MTKKSENSPNKKRNFCKHCNKTVIGSTYKFKSHLFKHDAVKPRFKCKYCSKEYFRNDTYKRHLRSHAGEKNQKKYVCDYCDRGFVNKYNLIAHLKNVHDDAINPNFVRFTCRACGVAFCEKRILDNHIRKYHFNIEFNDEPSHFNKLLNERWIEKVISTDACVEMTKINNNVIIIKKCTKVEEMPEIKKEVKTKKSLYRAQFIDQYSKAICDYCKKEMIKKSLKSHIRERHLNIRKYSCSECCKTFKRHYQLVDHKCGQVQRKRIKKK